MPERRRAARARAAVNAGYGRVEVLHGIDLAVGAGRARHRHRRQRRRQVHAAQGHRRARAPCARGR